MNIHQPASRMAPALSPRELVDDRPADAVFRVNKQIYVDPDIFELEIERIFGKVWNYICHESQVPQVGDYIATEIARQPVFATRSKDGDIKVFFDACAHRGARLTTRRTGKASTITCRYHGWCYDTNGKCTKIQYEKLGWPNGMPKGYRVDLTPLPRVANYRGFIFASLAADGEDIATYLGAAARVIDTMVDQSPQGVEVLDGSIRYVMRANWKFQSENGADGYHVAAVHRNYAATVSFREELVGDSLDPIKATEAGRILNRTNTRTGSYDLGQGHMLNWSDRANVAAIPLHEREPELLKQFPEGFVKWMVRRGRVLTAFPNLLINDVASSAIRVWRPVSVHETELETWCFAPVGESPKAREARIRKFEDFFFPSSLAVPDDVAAMEGAHEGSLATGMGWVEFARGREFAKDGADDAAEDMGIVPTTSNSQGDSETCFFGFYRKWHDLMTAGEDR
ncbi:MAG: Rieske 2Fe-2S domain-containing protein [Rhizobiales bacterium]|nr:Rieske 2Fe-2S domain-containing protein [Hyphomicrobiales bacterium]